MCTGRLLWSCTTIIICVLTRTKFVRRETRWCGIPRNNVRYPDGYAVSPWYTNNTTPARTARKLFIRREMQMEMFTSLSISDVVFSENNNQSLYTRGRSTNLLKILHQFEFNFCFFMSQSTIE